MAACSAFRHYHEPMLAASILDNIMAMPGDGIISPISLRLMHAEAGGRYREAR